MGASAKIDVVDIQIYADMTMTIGSELGFQLKDFYVSTFEFILLLNIHTIDWIADQSPWKHQC